MVPWCLVDAMVQHPICDCENSDDGIKRPYVNLWYRKSSGYALIFFFDGVNVTINRNLEEKLTLKWININDTNI